MTILGRTDLHQDSECKHILGEMDKVAAYGFRGSENFIFLYIYFMCMCVLLICMSVTKYLQCPRRPVERVGTGVTLQEVMNYQVEAGNPTGVLWTCALKG